MARLIILIAILGIGLILWHKIGNARGDERKKLIFWSIIAGVAAVLGLLAVTGHLNVITAAIAGLVALLPRLIHLVKYLPFLNRLYQQNKPNQQAHTSTPPPRGKATMTADEAMEILGLKTGFSKDDVIDAHRRMMQKNHPDRGGSDYLAAQINRAKETLLS